MLPLSPHRILVAEDERAVRMLLRVVLEGAGATVVEAENGSQALRLLELGESFDLVVTDLNMPELDGAGLARAVHVRTGNTLPVVLCTAMDPSIRSHGSHDLYASVVAKPFAPQDLVRAAAEALAARPRRASGTSRAAAI